ncbi:MAG: Maf family protein [Oscillospiraceae bacterium]|jgi:septum formation protein
MKIILASASPRRKELLKMLFDEFTIIPADIDENIAAERPHDAAEIIAVKKAQAIDALDSLVIACDTVVILENKLLGKPRDDNQAKQMLSLLSGRVHNVMTGVCLKFNEKSYSFTQKTSVEFYSLTESEIDTYIKTGEPLDKAGGYGIQGKGGLFVRQINGDYYNVVGLPVSRLKREIERFKTICGI